MATSKTKNVIKKITKTAIPNNVVSNLKKPIKKSVNKKITSIKNNLDKSNISSKAIIDKKEDIVHHPNNREDKLLNNESINNLDVSKEDNLNDVEFPNNILNNSTTKVLLKENKTELVKNSFTIDFRKYYFDNLLKINEMMMVSHSVMPNWYMYGLNYNIQLIKELKKVSPFHRE